LQDQRAVVDILQFEWQMQFGYRRFVIAPHYQMTTWLYDGVYLAPCINLTFALFILISTKKPLRHINGFLASIV
jgi:hypothetical protein